MSSQLDEILIALRSGQSTLQQACSKLTQSVRANPTGTRLWGMLIESRITQQQISPDVGRALIDAIESDTENYQPDKTMWLAPNAAKSPGAPPIVAAAQAVSSSDVLRIPTSAKARIEPQFQNMEQLRAFLWDGPSAKPADTQIAAERMETAPGLTPKRVPPPRSMPGSMPLLDAPELGAIIKGRYRLDAHLGYGGIGQVFSATDLEMARSGLGNSHVTVKMIAVDLKHEPQALTAIQKVVADTKTLRHPNIVSVYGLELENNRLFVIMEPLSGSWLGDQIRQVRKVGIAQEAAWPVIEGIANGLAHAHTKNIVHSDLSPYSVFVGNDGTPKIMGFGLIHALPTSNEAIDLLDTMTLRAYSEAYTADTWATHATPHPSDDLYPLGAIAYEMLTGIHPFKRQSLTTARQKNLQYEPIAGLNGRASKLIAHCLSFERAERPKNATRFVKRMQGSTFLRTLFGARFSIAGASSEK